MRSTKQSGVKRCHKQYRKNHTKQFKKLFTSFNEWKQARKESKKKNQRFALSITYLNEWKHFRIHFLWLIIDLYNNVFFWGSTTEKRKPENCFLSARVLVPKSVDHFVKRPEYVTGFVDKLSSVCFWPTVTHKISETNSSFHVK